MDKVSYSSDGGLFNLPWMVAEKEGYFAEEGLEVGMVHRDPSESESDCFDRKKETDFLSGKTQIYTVCQWGGVKRTAERAGGKIAFRNPVDGQYTLVASPKSGIATIEQLAGVPVAVARDAGSHYAALETLEEHLPGESIEVQHVGAGLARLEALLAEEVKAAVLLEPYTTIAVKRGAVLIAQCRPDPGVVVASDNLQRDVLERFARATNRAVDKINAAPDKYVDLLMEEVPESLREEVKLPTYTAMTAALSEEEFDHTQNWMIERGLLDAPVAYAEVTVSG